MEKIIKNKLKELAQQENVTILHAVESGSRAWGFASPDSDYDVRFIYIRPLEYYLKLEKTQDVIEWQLDETLDINGWDLKKALQLLHKSNPTLFEWNNSPMIYHTTTYWAGLSKEIDSFFSSKAGLYHYLNTAQSNYREYLKGDIVRLKKYFYVLRPILACKWIIKYQSPPPMLFTDLMDSVLEDDMKPIVYHLIAKKKNTPELGTGPQISVLNQYIDTNLEELKDFIKQQEESELASWSSFNQFFLDGLRFSTDQ